MYTYDPRYFWILFEGLILLTILDNCVDSIDSLSISLSLSNMNDLILTYFLTVTRSILHYSKRDSNSPKQFPSCVFMINVLFEYSFNHGGIFVDFFGDQNAFEVCRDPLVNVLSVDERYFKA